MSESLLFALAVAALYLLWCAAYPLAPCPWCGGRKTRGDGKGHYRLRRTCRVCHGEPWRRVGARLIGAGRQR